jgi:16S rRNA (guanine966-N2)-methyltransferase
MVKQPALRAGKNRPPALASETGELRIIGGLWRGRKLLFPALPGLRPSPNRVRETLFNWLTPELPGSHCLDLFAGSGALGLEALSRGAASGWFVDTARSAGNQIRQHLATLQCDAGHVVDADVTQWLKIKPAAAPRFHCVFLDPPFRQNLLNECCAQLEQGDWLSGNALIYVESAVDEAPPSVPSNWTLHRDKQAGQVAYRLFRRVAASPAN